MATSAETLYKIIDLMLKSPPADRDSAIKLLAAKSLLPKKMTEPPKVKKVSIFASKVAEDFAECKGIKIPEGFKGTAAHDRISVKDLKNLDSPKKEKTNASPSAQQFARDNGINIDNVKGSGADGKVLLKDVKDLKPEATDKADTDETPLKIKISSSAAKLMKQHGIDEEDLADIDGSGKDGTVVVKDLKELLEILKEEGSGDDSDDSEDLN